jgi:transposase
MYRWAENGSQNVPKPSQIPDRDPSPESERRRARPNEATLETVPKRTRRVFSAAEKLRIVKEADTCLASGRRGDLEALLRREGIYSSHLSSWRAQLGAHGATGLAAKKPGRKPRLTQAERRNVELEKRNAELERKLHVANVLIALQKKAHEVLGLALPESDGEP